MNLVKRFESFLIIHIILIIALIEFWFCAVWWVISGKSPEYVWLNDIFDFMKDQANERERK